MRDTTPHMPPAGPDEAEALAARAVGDYLNACRMDDPAQIADRLMKIVSVAGVMMAQANGADDAFDRLLNLMLLGGEMEMHGTPNKGVVGQLRRRDE